MGILLNSGNTEFEEAVNAEIYVDKTLLIEYANRVLRTPQKYICVSRPRRFGKSMAANMLTAYYCRDCDSRDIFSKFEISNSSDFETYFKRLVERQGMYSFGIYDRYFTDKEIWCTFCIEYV